MLFYQSCHFITVMLLLKLSSLKLRYLKLTYVKLCCYQVKFFKFKLLKVKSLLEWNCFIKVVLSNLSCFLKLKLL